VEHLEKMKQPLVALLKDPLDPLSLSSDARLHQGCQVMLPCQINDHVPFYRILSPNAVYVVKDNI